jgi:hypothetical protein
MHFLPGLCNKTFTQPLIEVIKLCVVWRITSRNVVTIPVAEQNHHPQRTPKLTQVSSLNLNDWEVFSIKWGTSLALYYIARVKKVQCEERKLDALYIFKHKENSKIDKEIF